jgi:hypothetical protein
LAESSSKFETRLLLQASNNSGAASPALMTGMSQAAQQASQVINKLLEAEERLISTMYG